MSHSSNQQIHEAIERYFLDPNSLTRQEQADLIDALREDTEARARFRRAAHIDAQLRYESSGEEPPVVPPPHRSPVSSPLSRWTFAIAATLLIAASVAYWNWPQAKPIDSDPIAGPMPEEIAPGVTPATSTAIAMLDVGHNQHFAEGLGPAGNEFFPGDYHLTEGAVTLDFQNGVAVSVESPAKFSIIDGMHMELQTGRARAIVPETGHGFVIATPTMEVEDLGTEFGVFVDEQQNQELHVFAGEVRLKQPNQASELLTENSALAWNAESQRRSISPDDRAFATSTSIGYRRWLDHSRMLRSDPSALFYFDFETDSRDSTQVVNLAESTVVPDGFLNGGIWATGRWPEKGALLFENRGDRIELDIPGTYHQVTIMGWVQMNRFDYALQSLFNTINYDPGEHHWNLQRNGAYRIGVNSEYNHTAPKSIPQFQWTHVAAQLDSVAKESVYYMNGEEIARYNWSTGRAIRYGPSSIGAYGYTNRHGKIVFERELRGRIDEFGLFSRILSASEIREAYEAGRNFQ